MNPSSGSRNTASVISGSTFGQGATINISNSEIVGNRDYSSNKSFRNGDITYLFILTRLRPQGLCQL